MFFTFFNSLWNEDWNESVIYQSDDTDNVDALPCLILKIFHLFVEIQGWLSLDCALIVLYPLRDERIE